ncbi:MAG: hypothetical protein AAF563_08785 [Pseudomonadota bacterium]
MQERFRACSCRAAVERAYRALKDRDEADESAFHAATKIYRWYHPNVSALDARFTVAEWLDQVD